MHYKIHGKRDMKNSKSSFWTKIEEANKRKVLYLFDGA